MPKHIDNCRNIVERDHSLISQASRSHYFPCVMKKGRGAWVEDVDGNEYIDLFSSSAVLNTGHCHPKVVQAIKDQVDDFIHFSTDYMYAEAQVELAKLLVDITPGDFAKKVCFGHSGSDSIDGAIKLARAYTNRPKIISFTGAYHGSTFGAISVSSISLNMKRKIGPLLPDVHHMPFPDCYRCKFNSKPESCSMECLKFFEDALESYIPPEEVAGILIEPIAGDLGFVEPPARYMKQLAELCEKHGILFMVDEVQQGFGRTGKWFSIEHFDVVPDILVAGKAMASGLPLSAVVARAEIVESLGEPAHLFTLQGNSTCASAAIATIEVINDEKLVENATELGDHALQRLRSLQDKYNVIGEIRGQGLSIGVELVKDKVTREKDPTAAAKVVYECWLNGVLLIFLAENVLRIQPPLVIARHDLDKALDVVEKAICDYANGSLSDEALDEVQGW